ncbi:hypothetical protein ACFFHM_01710 [Halalkalibacter kiskunsagensis]|uniref:OmpR/PhoB-type domain-containing protein n=1 Tax=Halalkalibacter kiskunsagensis TaxID=1548599 RepID=A0ABV6K7K2_9BACI
MRRLSDLTEEELLEKENDWWDREDDTDQSWINEGVQLYKRLSKINQRDITYQETLAYLLLKQGEDMKLRQHAYDEAIKKFNSVVRIDPSNSRACYRLGFLYFGQEAWAKSIDSFQQSLRKKASHARNQLEQDQKIKAHHYILKATQIIANETLGKIEQIPEKELEVFGEIKILIEEIKSGRRNKEEEKPYQMIINGWEYVNLTEEDYVQQSDPFKNKAHIILNQGTIHYTTVSFNTREIQIPYNQVPFLEYIMRNPEGVSREDLIQKRFRESNDPEAALRQNIRRLRSRLQELDPMYEFIKTVTGGYCWNNELEYRMLKHSRDITSDLLLD